VICSFRHKGLEAFYLRGTKRGIRPEHERRLRSVLLALASATGPADMDLPGLRLHPLTGKWRGFHSVWVSGNWRVVFRFEGTDVADVDYLDYH
jgi:proteic killer suppression protein